MKSAIRIAITLFPGVEELDAIAPYEVFGLARSLGANVVVDLVSHASAETIQAFHGLKISSIIPLREDVYYDIIIVPGGAWISQEKTGVRLAVEEGVLPNILRKRHEDGAVLAGICTGTFLLLEAGVLLGRPATTHHMALEKLRACTMNVVEERVVDAGSVLTCAGITSALDLSLWIVERFFGSELSQRVEDLLEYKRRGGIFRFTAEA